MEKQIRDYLATVVRFQNAARFDMLSASQTTWEAFTAMENATRNLFEVLNANDRTKDNTREVENGK